MILESWVLLALALCCLALSALILWRQPSAPPPGQAQRDEGERVTFASAEQRALPSPSLPRARWLEASAPGNPFDRRVLDLTPLTKTMISLSDDAETARRVIGWRPNCLAELDTSPCAGAPARSCRLSYPAARVLPDGLLFTPQTMEHKWVLALRGDELIFARSWTGAVELVARVRREPEQLVVEELRAAQDQGPLAQFGDLVETIDWLIRTLALSERSPLPVRPQGADALAESPLLAFSLFGEQVHCAAEGWAPAAPVRPIRSDGLLVDAVRRGERERIRELVASGESLEAPSTFAGYTALFVPLISGELELLELLLALGADPNVRAEREQHALGIGIIHSAPLACLQALLDAGADPFAVNVDGFGGLHAAAESNNAAVIPWLLELGLELELATHRGHTALLIACGLGHLDAAKALLAAGADRGATDPEGRDARALAEQEGRLELAALLDDRG